VSPVYCNICVKSGGSALKNRWLTHGARAADFPGAVATMRCFVLATPKMLYTYTAGASWSLGDPAALSNPHGKKRAAQSTRMA
jgi:hypothetical protein